MPRLLMRVVLMLACAAAEAQDLEPRRWTPLPPGLNVIGAGVVGLAGVPGGPGLPGVRSGSRAG